MGSQCSPFGASGRFLRAAGVSWDLHFVAGFIVEKKKRKKKEDKLFFGCVVIGIILEELSTCCFCVLGLSCRFSFSSTPKENVSRPFFKNFVNQKKVEKSKAPLS